ncbi:MAG: helix-turn-helix domain-containing protein [Clostridia bacterium]|nr:helix-turn-helix domain-containing protein [Clostridia bacterium]
MESEFKANYYAIIPSYVRYNHNLKFAERLMYGEITALSNKEGFCFASNRYFAELYGVSLSTISRWISHLSEFGYIDIELIRNEKKEIVERRLYVMDTPYTQNNQYPYMQNSQYPIRKKRKDNNININRIDRLFYYFINKGQKFPDELLEYKNDIIDVLEKYEMIYSKEMLEVLTNENIEKIKLISYCLAMLVKENLKNLLHKVNRSKLINLYDECKIREKENISTDNEILNFQNYYYKSLKNKLLEGQNPYFCGTKNDEIENEGEEI